MTSRCARWRAPGLLASMSLLAGMAALPAQAGPGAAWGAIASRPGAYGYSYNHGTRDAAERSALAQCDHAAGRAGRCEVRASFDRACAALALGNFGEWGAGVAPTQAAATKTAIDACESHLPTEPCKLTVKVCSPG